jgi:hypothetical protein
MVNNSLPKIERATVEELRAVMPTDSGLGTGTYRSLNFIDAGTLNPQPFPCTGRIP